MYSYTNLCNIFLQYLKDMLARIRSWFSREDPKEDVKSQSNAQSKPKSEGISDDTRNEICMSFFSTLVEGVKIAMACLLSIFVPQYCEETGTTCTLQENFSNLTTFNEFVIFWNFFTLGFFINLIYVISKREAYFISHLEESRAEPYNSFPENLAPYPRIVMRVKQYNKRLKSCTYWTLGVFTLNVLFSAILIYNYFYDGFRSVSTLLANVLLVSSKLYALYTTANDCTGFKPLALSCTKQTSVSYNVVDEAYEIKSDGGPKVYNLRISIDAGKKRKKTVRCRSKSAR